MSLGAKWPGSRRRPSPATVANAGTHSLRAEVALLIAANGLTLIAASRFDFGPLEVLWVYWLQSALMGLRLAFPPAHRALGGAPPVEPSTGPRPPPNPARIARALLVPYALFHLVYFLFLLAISLSVDADGTIVVRDGESGARRLVFVGSFDAVRMILLPGLALVLALAHRSDSRSASESDPSQIVVASLLLYARVVPIHVSTILAVVLGGSATVVTFILVKSMIEVLTVLVLRSLGSAR